MDSRQPVPVTVIIPAWLRDAQDIDWLIEALNSVIDQTALCQCVIVENGSNFLPDVHGPYINIIHSEKGLSIARNTGVKDSKTEFFFPLDCNDWIEPSAIETLYNRRPEKGFVYGSTMLFTGQRGAGDQHYYEAKPYDFNEVLKMVYFPCGVLQRKSEWETIGGWRESMTMLEDWDYWITAGERGVCGTAITNLIYWYRQHGGIVQSNTHTPAWEETKQLIKSYHSDSYKGVYTPMCCGNKASLPKKAAQVAPQVNLSVNAQSFPGKDGFMLIDYAGGNVGKMTFYGPVTHTRYVAGGSKPRISIDIRDAVTGKRDALGLLELMEHNQPTFKKVVA